MEQRPLRVVHYVNQMFGGLGGEEAAGSGPRLVEGPVGPGRALAQVLGAEGTVVATVICGDNYVAERLETAVPELVALVRSAAPDLLLAGPAFNAGRYGQACGALCQAVSRELGIPAVTGMHEENPGVELYHRDVYVLRTGDSAREMAAALAAMLRLARKLQAGEPLGRPEAEGYFPRGQVVLEMAEHTAARRAVDMLLAKLAGAPFQSEIRLPKFPTTPAPPPVPDLSRAVVAPVTDGGLVPKGNPDQVEPRAATKFGVYPIGAADTLDAAQYDVTHSGYDNTSVRQDPNRLVPVDVARELEREGRIGRLHDHFISTTGVGTPLDRGRQLGRDIAAHLKGAGVEAVILTST